MIRRTPFPLERQRIGPAALLVAALAVGACGASQAPTGTGFAGSPSSPTAPAAGAGSSAAATGSAAPVVDLKPTPAISESAEPISGSRTATGDVPDNAVFLTYRDAAHRFAIQYVEGWQVIPDGGGVGIADKDSSESVAVIAQADLSAYLATDLSSLQAQPGFKLIDENQVRVNGKVYMHRQYHALSQPDPVTGKRVPSMVERYYVQGTGAIATVTLSTPDGVDNVDAFRQMIESFKWL